jgi:DNA-binding response OmpR family regulator
MDDLNKRNPVILLVEDDVVLSKMYATKLIADGFEVLIAHDGLSGWETIKSKKFDLMVLDIMMPKMNGIELLSRINEELGKLNFPVLMLTNLTEKEEQKKSMDLGAREFLIKSDLTPGQLVEKIKFYLN